MPDEVDGICAQEMQGRALHNEEILEMIPPAYRFEEERSNLNSSNYILGICSLLMSKNRLC